MEMKKIKTIIIWMAFITFSLNGCSVYMAANQPKAKNVDLFQIGTSRNALLAEFGYPTATETRNGKKYEIYRFTQGYSGGAKAGRAVGHAVADVLTLGLWEVVGTPVESINDGELTAYEVSYDSSDKIDQVVLLTADGGAIPNANSSSGGTMPKQNTAPATSDATSQVPVM
jgi:outer membrane protein assembly factor BamE (lipoprotein component of BamABCDE complex)